MKRNIFKRSFKLLLNIVFPNHCAICGNIIDDFSPNDICINCVQRNMPYIHRDVYLRCEKCGKVLDFDNRICICKNEKLYFDGVRSMLYYQSISVNLIHSMKFSHRYSLCEDFGFMMAHYYKNYILCHDVIIAVPLGKKRMHERGYNQSEITAKTISKVTNIIIIKDLVYRKKETEPLSIVGDHSKRKSVVKDAFRVRNSFKYKVKDKRVLIIDDVFTTGATVNEMAKEIRDNCEVSSIGVLTIARTY